MTVAAGDTLIVVEIYYAYTTIWTPITYSNVLSNQTLYHRAFFRPRVGTLTTIS